MFSLKTNKPIANEFVIFVIKKVSVATNYKLLFTNFVKYVKEKENSF